MTLPVALLPPLARELVDLIGLPATLRLVEARGGRTIDLAKGKRARGQAQIQAIAECIGKIAADKLVKQYGGTPLRVPKCAAALRAAQDAQIQARFDMLTSSAGLSARKAVAELVGEFGLVDRSIWRALKRPSSEAEVVQQSADDRQLLMFF